jgi:hypothetical protein
MPEAGRRRPARRPASRIAFINHFKGTQGAGRAVAPPAHGVCRYALRGVARPQELYALDSTGAEG